VAAFFVAVFLAVFLAGVAAVRAGPGALRAGAFCTGALCAGAFAAAAFLPTRFCGFAAPAGAFFAPRARFDAPDPEVASGGVTPASYAPLRTLLTRV
jgi:hypothetical protein